MGALPFRMTKSNGKSAFQSTKIYCLLDYFLANRWGSWVVMKKTLVCLQPSLKCQPFKKRWHTYTTTRWEWNRFGKTSKACLLATPFNTIIPLKTPLTWLLLGVSWVFPAVWVDQGLCWTDRGGEGRDGRTSEGLASMAGCKFNTHQEARSHGQSRAAGTHFFTGYWEW